MQGESALETEHSDAQITRHPVRSAHLFFLLLFLTSSCAIKKPIERPIIICNSFYDITGSTELRPQPALITLSFLADHLLVKALIEEENLEATLIKRDTTIYKEDCLEIFLDPNADGKNYYEIQINVLGAIADIKLRSAIGNVNKSQNMIDWDIPLENLNVSYKGTINNALDKDHSWAVELRIPWTLITEGMPRSGDVWAYNVMLVDHHLENVDHWVSAPTGKRYIHIPEKWLRYTF